jgi:hypothetical protein
MSRTAGLIAMNHGRRYWQITRSPPSVLMAPRQVVLAYLGTADLLLARVQPKAPARLLIDRLCAQASAGGPTSANTSSWPPSTVWSFQPAKLACRLGSEKGHSGVGCPWLPGSYVRSACGIPCTRSTNGPSAASRPISDALWWRIRTRYPVPPF